MNPEQEKRVAAISRNPIAITPVVSSQIAALGHDPETNRLAVRFQPKAGFERGSLYYYDNFSAEDFSAFSTAESIGSYFHNNIRPAKEKWPYVKIEDDSSADDGSQKEAVAQSETQQAA